MSDSKSKSCINHDGSHWSGLLSNNKVMAGGKSKKRALKSKRGGGRVYQFFDNLEHKFLGPKAGLSAMSAKAGDNVGTNACTNGSSGQYFNKEMSGLQPLKPASLSGGKKKSKKSGRKPKSSHSKKMKSRRLRRAKGGGCPCAAGGGRKRSKKNSRRHSKKGGSAKDMGPHGYSLAGEYAPKELGYGALASPAPYKLYNKCS